MIQVIAQLKYTTENARWIPSLPPGSFRCAPLGDNRIGHQKGNQLGLHNSAAVGIDGELAGENLILVDSLFDDCPATSAFSV